jgi:hypothetical protein
VCRSPSFPPGARPNFRPCSQRRCLFRLRRNELERPVRALRALTFPFVLSLLTPLQTADRPHRLRQRIGFKTYGKIDVVVANAGIPLPDLNFETTDDELKVRPQSLPSLIAFRTDDSSYAEARSSRPRRQYPRGGVQFARLSFPLSMVPTPESFRLLQHRLSQVTTSAKTTRPPVGSSKPWSLLALSVRPFPLRLIRKLTFSPLDSRLRFRSRHPDPLHHLQACRPRTRKVSRSASCGTGSWVRFPSPSLSFFLPSSLPNSTQNDLHRSLLRPHPDPPSRVHRDA